MDNYIDKTQINNALAEIFKVVSRANKYIDETTPWVLGKDETKKARLATVLYNLLESIRIATTLLSAFMPTTMPKVFAQIGATDVATYENADKWNVLPPDTTVTRGEVLFPRIDVDKEIEELNAIIQKNVEKAQAEENKELIHFFRRKGSFTLQSGSVYQDAFFCMCSDLKVRSVFFSAAAWELLILQFLYGV